MSKGIRSNKAKKPHGISNNTGWHMELVDGQMRRISHNPRLSESYPETAAQWHPERNGEISVNDVTGLSTYNAFWLCARGHEWQRQVNRRTIHGSDCPHCELNASSLATLFPYLAKEWSTRNGALTPAGIRSKSDSLVWWSCPVKNHDDYQHQVCQRTARLKPLGCPVCAGIKPEKSDSFASLFPDLAKEWHPKLNEHLH
jgi:hypothetical protein